MKKCMLVILVLLLGISAVNAQTKKGDKGITFEIDGLELGSFLNGIGGKYFWKDNQAVVASVFYSKKKNQEVQYDYIWYPDTMPKTDSYEYGLYTGLESYLNRNGKSAPFIGIGVSYNYRDGKTAEFRPGGEPMFTIHTSEKRFGIVGSLGFEYRFNRNIAISGQHQFSYIIGRSKEDYTDRHDVTGGFASEFWKIDSSTSILRMTIYF